MNDNRFLADDTEDQNKPKTDNTQVVKSAPTPDDNIRPEGPFEHTRDTARPTEAEVKEAKNEE